MRTPRTTGKGRFLQVCQLFAGLFPAGLQQRTETGLGRVSFRSVLFNSLMLLGNCRNKTRVALPLRTDFEQLSYTPAQQFRVVRCGTQTADVPRTRRT